MITQGFSSRFWGSTDGVVRTSRRATSGRASARPMAQENWAERVETAVKNGAEYLLSIQSEEGYWHGELEADTTLESDYIYYLYVLGKAEPDRIVKLANYVRRKQMEDGGWPIYPGGPSELNATTKAYFALKLAGDSADAPHMVKAREIVHRLAGSNRPTPT